MKRHNALLASNTVSGSEREKFMDAVIRTEGLAKRFGTVEALKPLDLEVSQGEVLGYLGPNGAGKTTTIRLLLGLLRPTGGRAEIFGLDVQGDTVAAHRRLAYVATVLLFRATVALVVVEVMRSP